MGNVVPVGGATYSGSSHDTAGTATITYTDNSTQTFTLALTDWGYPTAVGGNLIAATSPYFNNQTGQVQNQRSVNVYYSEVTLQTGKTIQSVTLPSTTSTGELHIFALGTK